MYFSYFLSKCLVSVPILAIQLLLIRCVSSLNLTNEYLNHKCLINQGKYERGSNYENNLNRLYRDILKQTYFQDGFSHTSIEKESDPTTVIFQCRGDSYGSKCRTCSATAVAGFRRKCPRNKGGTIWYDQCFLDVNMINNETPRKTDYENIFSMHNSNNVIGDTKSFNNKTKDLLHELTLKADKPTKDGLNFLYYAAGEKKLGTKKLYAMVQCAQDVYDCKGCLKWSIMELFKSWDSKQGGRVLGTTCNVRYELYPFLRT